MEENKGNIVVGQGNLSKILNVSRERVSLWCGWGYIPFKKEGRLFIFDLEEVKKCLVNTHTLKRKSKQ